MKIPSSAESKKSVMVAAAVVVVALPLGCALARRAGATATAGAAAWSSSSVVNGVYRLEWSEKEAIAAGAPYSSAHADFGWAHGNHVVITMTLRDGHLNFTDRHVICRNTYTVSGQTVSIQNVAPCFGRIIARWSLLNGQLRLRVTQATDPGDAVIFGRKPWKRIAYVAPGRPAAPTWKLVSPTGPAAVARAQTAAEKGWITPSWGY